MSEPPPFPSYRTLLREGRPAGTSWGLWGDADEVGALNRLSAERVRRAAALVRRGAVFPLDWGYANPDPVLFGRGPIEHVVKDHGTSLDDHFNRFYPHGGTHWDALSHYSHPQHGYYGGRTTAEVTTPAAKNSISGWAVRGVVGRFALADVGRRRNAGGRPISYATDEAIPIDDVRSVLDAQGTVLEFGDILLVRTGWIEWYAGRTQAEREAMSERLYDFASPGLSCAEETIEWIWDAGVTAVAADNPAVEPLPFDWTGHSLHADLKAALGISLGEFFALDALADDCAADGSYVGMLASAPLNYVGATGSPANALALK